MLDYDKIDVSEGIDFNKTSSSKECGICHDWNFLDKEFEVSTVSLQWLSRCINDVY